MVQFERNEVRPRRWGVQPSDISLGTEDKQIGGMPMTLGKAAVPFEGGEGDQVSFSP